MTRLQALGRYLNMRTHTHTHRHRIRPQQLVCLCRHTEVPTRMLVELTVNCLWIHLHTGVCLKRYNDDDDDDDAIYRFFAGRS